MYIYHSILQITPLCQPTLLVGKYHKRNGTNTIRRLTFIVYMNNMHNHLNFVAQKAFVWYQLVDNLGGNVPFALKWGPRGQRPPTARYLPPKSRSQ